MRSFEPDRWHVDEHGDYFAWHTTSWSGKFPDRVYEIRYYKNGTLTCDCLGAYHWDFASDIMAEDGCCHIKAKRLDLR